jgi:hypothetical protein
VLVVAYATGLTAGAQARDPWLGTWKTNLAKSTFSPGPKPTVAGIVKVEAVADGYKTTIDGADAQGKPTHTETLWKFDGKDTPVKGAPAPNSTSAFKRIDGRTFEVTSKIDGKPTVITRVAVAADGKSLTATQTGTDAQGQKVNNVIVADKQ